MDTDLRVELSITPKDMDLLRALGIAISQRNIAEAEAERLREALAMFADPECWRKTNDTNVLGFPIKVWAWRTIDVPWETARQMLNTDKQD